MVFRKRPASEEGAVLLLILLIMALISVMVLSWSQEWRMELKLAGNFREARENHRLAEAGVYYALGKLVATKNAETGAGGVPGGMVEPSAEAQDLWQADGRPYVLKLPKGLVEVRLEDEGGKINLNRAPEVLLQQLFVVLGVPEMQIRTMVDSIQDWRTKGDQALPYGAKNSYYLSLDPPYAAKNGFFETVEELSWVRGFEGSPLTNRLGEFLTVESTSRGININTASKEVLQTTGFPLDVAAAIIATRETMPLRDAAGIAQWDTNRLEQTEPLVFQTSPFFTIKSTGMVRKDGGRHTIKAIVRLNPNAPTPWEIRSWVDDFSG
jgi:general secretion pathway protein K